MRTNTDLSDAAQAFQTLHTARHDADYDHAADFTKAEVLTLIDSASDAVKKLLDLRKTQDHQVFATHLALATRTRS